MAKVLQVWWGLQGVGGVITLSSDQRLLLYLPFGPPAPPGLSLVTGLNKWVSVVKN